MPLYYFFHTNTLSVVIYTQEKRCQQEVFSARLWGAVALDNELKSNLQDYCKGVLIDHLHLYLIFCKLVLTNYCLLQFPMLQQLWNDKCAATVQKKCKFRRNLTAVLYSRERKDRYDQLLHYKRKVLEYRYFLMNKFP